MERPGVNDMKHLILKALEKTSLVTGSMYHTVTLEP